MAKFNVIVLALIFWFLSLNFALATEKPAFVTIVNPIRNRQLWQNLDFLNDQIGALQKFNLSATWLLQYDVLGDKEVVDRLKKLPQDEIGVFIEVSENLASEANVAYLIGQGDWARADKVFFSGYQPKERRRMVEVLLEKFKKTFGFYPKSVGAWYLDPVTLDYLVDKYQVEAALDCADQYSTDSYQIWGKPWGLPFYPSRLNSLVPAQTLKNKLPVVKVQWALRDPELGFGRGVADSTYSLQANDYQGHHDLGTDYFKKLLDVYLKTSNQFSQATVGLEVGQEAQFLPEFERQIEVLAAKKEAQEIQIMTLSQFASWYQEKFPEISPAYIIKSGKTNWYTSPWVRLGKESRFYDEEFMEKDLILADSRRQLYRVAGEKIELSGVRRLKRLISQLILSLKSWPWPRYSWPPIRFTTLDKTKIIGLEIDKTRLLGFKFPPLVLGVFDYPFQVLVRFKTWPKIQILPLFFTSDSQLQLEELRERNKGSSLLIFKKEEIDPPMMARLEGQGKRLILDNSEFQVWR